MSVARGWWILLSGEWILFLTCPTGFKDKFLGGIEIREVLESILLIIFFFLGGGGEGQLNLILGWNMLATVYPKNKL